MDIYTDMLNALCASSTENNKNDDTSHAENNKNSDTSQFTITTEECQLNARQDVTPVSKEEGDNIALLVGDGHGGSHASDILSHYKHSSDILNHILHHGLEAAMNLAQNKCKNCLDGAMLVLAHYKKSTRVLRVISVGDTSCSVYQNNKLIFEQPHHDISYFKNKGYGDCTTGVDLGGNKYGEILIDTSKENPIMTPQPDGKTMLLPLSETYFMFKNEKGFMTKYNCIEKIAGASFVGHKDVPRLPAIVSEIIIDKGSFHIVMTSDGVSDIMHPEDAIMRDATVTANTVVSEAIKRWSTPFFNAIKGYEDKKDKTKMFNIGGPIEKKVVDCELVDYCQCGDDISVLVMNVVEDE
tara:strand:- start:160 stop:1221 length:1062 start_codon:yes stop_codon:yes gene_type:complete